MTTLSVDRHGNNLTAGVFTHAAQAVLATDRSSILTILRITLGLVMLPHGLQKTLGWFGGYGFSGTMGWFASIGIPTVLGFLAIAAETAGALALITGFTTRIAAAGVAAVMLVAIPMHKANGFFMNWSGQQKGEGFEYHLLALAIALALIIGGAGRFSIDRALARRKQ
jgi:putative oxidoreductase